MNNSHSSAPRFSVIIPAYNGQAYLALLLNSVDKTTSCHLRGPGCVEVVLVDNASTDATANLSRTRGCRVVHEERCVIAAVRDAGAGMATGQVLVFIDADNIIHPDTFNAIDRCLSTGKIIAGASGVRMQRMYSGIAVTYVLLVPLTWLTGMDTGAVFCRQENFDAVDGFNEECFFAQEVRFLWDLKRLGRVREQKLTRITSIQAIYSSRKFDKHGDWHYLWLILRFPYGVLLSRRFMDDFAQIYCMVISAIMYGKLTPTCSALRKASIYTPLGNGAFSTILEKEYIRTRDENEVSSICLEKTTPL